MKKSINSLNLKIEEKTQKRQGFKKIKEILLSFYFLSFFFPYLAMARDFLSSVENASSQIRQIIAVVGVLALMIAGVCFYWSKKLGMEKLSSAIIGTVVVVAIIGVLAAVAIPAYQKYQRTAKVNVIAATLNQVEKAFPACLTVDNFANCDDPNIAGTLKGQAGAKIAGSTDGSTNACWKTELTSDMSVNGCTQINANGVRIKRTLSFPIGTACSSLLESTPTAGACVAAGCTPATPGASCGGGSSTAVGATTGCTLGICTP